MPSLKKLFIDEANEKRQPNRHYPIFIILVTLIDIALLIYTIVSNNGLVSMSENSMAGPSNYTLLRNGAKFVPCMKSTPDLALKQIVTCPSNRTCTYEEYLSYVCNTETFKGFPYQAYRFFIPMFLHAGIIHLVMNLVSQLMFGILLERKFGWIRIGIIYILSGIGGTLLSAVGLPRSPGVGASGAVYGILSVFLMDGIRNWKEPGQNRCSLLFDAVFAIGSLIVGLFVPIIDYMAHIGGFLVGILSGLFLCPNLYWRCGRDIQVTKAKLIYMGISFACLLAFFLGGFIGFYRAETPILY